MVRWMLGSVLALALLAGGMSIGAPSASAGQRKAGTSFVKKGHKGGKHGHKGKGKGKGRGKGGHKGGRKKA